MNGIIRFGFYCRLLVDIIFDIMNSDWKPLFFFESGFNTILLLLINLL